MKGLLLFAHGSRNPAWATHFETLRARVAQAAPEQRVGLCYLELCEPDFAAGVNALAELGVTDIEVAPVFLAPGKHTMEDLPALIAAAKRAHPSLRITSKLTLLEDEAMLNAIARAAVA
jgi:sirohydrochlorin cobaltochelatase